jgi:preprotein translocase subunit SecF
VELKEDKMAKQTSTYRSDEIATHEDHGKIDFVKIAPLMGGISIILTIVAIMLVMTKGLNYGIDFAGGTEIQLRFAQPIEAHQLRLAIEEAGIKNPVVQSFGGNGHNEFLIRLETPHGATEKETNELIAKDVVKIRETLKAKFGLTDDGVLRVDTVGPAVGSELRKSGLLAAFYSFLVILIYVAMRFDYKYAPGAVLCLVHDTIFTIGVYSILGREFNTQIMAAILTLIGYSLNDTIVTFDRIRETAPHYKGVMSMKWIINKAINDMLGRTILTAGCTMLAVLGLYFFGGGVIAEIAFCLIIGILIGTYSSVYVAAPLILVMEKFKKEAA